MKQIFRNNNLSSYNNELSLAMIPSIEEKVEKNKNITITKEISSDQNKEFYQFLEISGFNKEKIMKLINEYWDSIIDFSSQTNNVKLFEIKQKP